MPNQSIAVPVVERKTVTTWRTTDPVFKHTYYLYGTGNWPRLYFSGIVNPRFRQQIAGLVDAGTAYRAESFRLEKRRQSYASAIQPWTWGGNYDIQRYSGDGMAQYIVSAYQGDVSTCDNLARVRFFQKLQSDFQAGTFLGELRETAAMLRKPALALRRGVDRFYEINRARRNALVSKARGAKGHRDALKQYRQDAASQYLEVQFGMRPLVADINGFFELMSDMLSRPVVDHYTAREVIERNLPWETVLSGTETSRLTYTYRRALKYRTEVVYRAAVFSRTDSDFPFGQALGLTPENWVPTAYELLPYSWLLDYFTTVGDALNAWAISQRLRYVYCSRTVRTRTRTYLENRPGILPTVEPKMTNVELVDGYLQSVANKTQRDPMPSVPLPYLQVRSKLSTIRGLNIAALVASREEDRRFSNRHRY